MGKLWGTVGVLILMASHVAMAEEPKATKSARQPAQAKKAARAVVAEPESAPEYPVASLSEYQHQADGGRLEITPSLTYTSVTFRYKRGTTSSVEQSGFGLAVKADYGINDMFSAGGELGYTGLSNDTTSTPGTASRSTTQSGLVDPLLFFNGRHLLGPGTLRYTVKFSFSIETNRTEANGDSNMASGGTSINTGVGYELPAGPGVVGARMAYDIIQGDRTQDVMTSGGMVSTTVTGGNTFTLATFYEWNLAPWTLGGDISIEANQKTKTEVGGRSTDNDDQHTVYYFGLYAPFQATPDTVILPRIQYGSYSPGNAAVRQYLKSASGFQFTIAARFAF